MIKLISSDMDGTLLDSYRQITPINVEAIKRAQENGINFIINTGREYPNARGGMPFEDLCERILEEASTGKF